MDIHVALELERSIHDDAQVALGQTVHREVHLDARDVAHLLLVESDRGKAY
jgi:hypothetical protein